MSFIRPDLAALTAYTAHSPEALPPTLPLDPLDTNECPYDLPRDLKQKLAWSYEQQIAANRYPDGDYLELKRAIATYVNTSVPDANPQLSAANISVGNGSDELIRSVLIATCVSRSGSILVANPTFSMYGILAQTLGIPVVSVDRSDTDFAFPIVEANTAIAQARDPVRIIFVVHPNSPTANALTSAELEWLRQLPSDILVVIDEAYFEFSQASVVTELLQHPNWLILRTFSKAFRLAAHRIGYAIAHPDLIATLEKVRLPYNLPSFTQTAALTALSHRTDLLAVIPDILRSRDRLLSDLQAIDQLKIWPSDANFIYARLQPHAPSDLTLQSIQQTLKAQGTLIRHTGGGLRITVGSPDQNQRTLDRLISLFTQP